MATAMDLTITVAILLAAVLLADGRMRAQEAAPPGVALADFAARRHPQPVRVGDLINRTVLQPLESRPVLGHVKQVVRLGDAYAIIMNVGGWFGFGGRLVAVPVDAMVLLGSELEVLDFTPEQLRTFPAFDGAGGSPVASDEYIRMGLAHPSH